MSESANTSVKVCYSLPPSAQYAKGHMVIFEAPTQAEVDEQLEEALRPDSNFLERILEVGGLLVAGQVAQTGTATPASEEKSDSQPNAGSGNFCEHGKRVWKEGDKNGKHWQGWFCPNNEKSCKPVWS